MLDLPLAFVTSGLEHVEVIVRCQMGRYQADSGEGDGSVREQIQDDGEATRYPGGLDAPVGRVLGQV
jgi:hypothetical protein